MRLSTLTPTLAVGRPAVCYMQALAQSRHAHSASCFYTQDYREELMLIFKKVNSSSREQTHFVNYLNVIIYFGHRSTLETHLLV